MELLVDTVLHCIGQKWLPLRPWAVKALHGHGFNSRDESRIADFDMLMHAAYVNDDQNISGIFHMTERKDVHNILARGLISGSVVNPVVGEDFVACGTCPHWDSRTRL